MTHPLTIIFDMDGVILDTESLVYRCWKELSDSYALTDIDPIFLSTIGTTRKYTGEVMRQHYGTDFPYDAFDDAVSRLFHQIADSEGIPVKSGVRELLTYLSARDCQVGLATSTRQVIAESELRHAGIFSFFDVIVGGDQIAHSKPAPDIYLAICRKMEVCPQTTFAVEDSYNGIRAAAGAGMLPIMVPDLLPPTPEIKTLCHAVFPDLHHVQAYLEKQNGC